MSTYKNFLISAGILGFLFFGGVPDTALATERVGLKLSPAVVEEKANPGDVISFTISVINVGSEGQTYYSRAKNVKGADRDGATIVADEGEETDFELASWVDIRGSFFLAPKASAEVPVRIKVPHDASPGSHFGVIYFSITPPNLSKDTTGLGVGYESGTIVSLRVAGDVKESLRIIDFTPSQNIYGSSEALFRLYIENTGNVLLRPTAIIEVFDWFGRKVGVLFVNEKGNALFPKAEKEFEASWKGEELTFGRHKVSLAVGYGDVSKKTEYAVRYFWVIPKQLTLWTLGILTVLILGVFLLVKYSAHSALKKFKKTLNSTASQYTHKQRSHGLSFRELLVMTCVLFVCIVGLLLVLLLFFS